MEKAIGIFILIVALAGGIYVINHGVQSFKLDLPTSSKPYRTSDYYSFDSLSGAENRSRVRISSMRPVSYFNSYTEIVLTADMSSGGSVRLTGWKLKNAQNVSFEIPQAQEVYETGGMVQDIVLRSGERVVLYGAPNTRGNFRLNKCVGYLEAAAPMTPSLPRSCPVPSASDVVPLSAACQSYVKSLGSCQIPASVPPISFDDAACQHFLNTLNYTGCVGRYRGSSDFLSPEWRVWDIGLNVWKPEHDIVQLYDEENRLVDEYQY